MLGVRTQTISGRRCVCVTYLKTVAGPNWPVHLYVTHTYCKMSDLNASSVTSAGRPWQIWPPPPVITVLLTSWFRSAGVFPPKHVIQDYWEHLEKTKCCSVCVESEIRLTTTPSATTGDYFTLVRANYAARLLQETLEETSLFTQISHLLNLPPHIHWRPKGRLKSVFTWFFLPSVHLSCYSWSPQTSGLAAERMHVHTAAGAETSSSLSDID